MKHIVMNPEGKYLYLGSTDQPEWVDNIDLATDIGGGTVGTTNPRP